jgi:hypothetical protein
MGIDTFFLTLIRKEKEIKINNIEVSENKKDKKELLSPKRKEIIKRNKSMENFMKFSWAWTN